MQPDLEQRLLSSIERATGLRLKTNQMTQCRAALLQLAMQRNEELADTVSWLESDLVALQRFSAMFTIPETHFHRIQPQIQALRAKVLPDLLVQKKMQRRWRFWSAGCSSGEEVYTLIILALEAAPDWQLEVLGTDLNAVVLERAEQAVYGQWSFRDTPPEWRNKWFLQVANTWRVADTVRHRAHFALLNLIAESWDVPKNLDLILCRNVTIYFSNQRAQEVYCHLAIHLAEDGWLILGPSDPPPTEQTLERSQLQAVFEEGAILWQRVTRAKKPMVPKNLEHKTNPELTTRTPTLEFVPRNATVEFVPRNATVEFVPRNATVEMPAPIPIISSQNTLTLEGLTLLEQNDAIAALAILRRAVYLDPNDAVTQFALAKASIAANDKKRAQTALRQARRLIASLPDDAMLSLETTVQDLNRAIQALTGQLK